MTSLKCFSFNCYALCDCLHDEDITFLETETEITSNVVKLIERAKRFEFLSSNLDRDVNLSIADDLPYERLANEHLKTVLSPESTLDCITLRKLPNLIYFDCKAFRCRCDTVHGELGKYWPHVTKKKMKNLKHLQHASVPIDDDHFQKIVKARGEQLESVFLIYHAYHERVQLNTDLCRLTQSSCPNLRSLSIEPDILSHLADLTFEKLEEIQIRCDSAIAHVSMIQEEQKDFLLTAFKQFLRNHENLKRIIDGQQLQMLWPTRLRNNYG